MAYFNNKRVPLFINSGGGGSKIYFHNITCRYDNQNWIFRLWSNREAEYTTASKNNLINDCNLGYAVPARLIAPNSAISIYGFISNAFLILTYEADNAAPKCKKIPIDDAGFTISSDAVVKL